MPDPFVVRPRTPRAPDPRGAAAATRERAPRSAPAAARHPALAPLAPFLNDPEVTDLFVNGESGLFIDRGAGATRVPEWSATESEARALAVALIALGDRHLDDGAPAVDVKLPGGLRVHAVLPPVSAEGTAISIRVARLRRPDLDRLQRLGMFDDAARHGLERCVGRRENLLVTGAAGAGKTTLLAALLSCAEPLERIVTVEDLAELQLDHPHHVRLEARQPNLEGAGAITLARLVREALRMRPDRLVVGECRGEEVRDLLGALNTGHDGGAGTLHANSIADAATRLEALGALAGLDDAALARQVSSAIHRVLHVERGSDGVRRLAGVGRPVLDGAGRLSIVEASWPS
ncbi:TadA family conjugal transfer-associated ATPase [Microbacterium fluvii]|uniref:TadA family conjugal transfer-associated ATPase n=1 Tax=Microbacterium fluvii TaxID=415215 RepID=A0ABW2H9R1_9MICO|nr:TadA family conjugal transfer-associated ATPase [Microbacterium fluvii]MCU4671712.1 TadA family conjugal transfer-associated ATPase [Microbacterium fluvii]